MTVAKGNVSRPSSRGDGACLTRARRTICLYEVVHASRIDFRPVCLSNLEDLFSLLHLTQCEQYQAAVTAAAAHFKHPAKQ